MNYKISIVMGYINRKTQLIKTLESFEKSKHKNYEVIIVNDGDENMDDIINNYNNIKIFKKPIKYYNPCMTFNYGFLQATGDIICIQNPECIHIGDILLKINDNLKNNDCMVFNCYFFERYEQNEALYTTQNIQELLKTSKNKKWFTNYENWSVHHVINPTILYFCMALFRKKLEKIDYFSSKYKDGYCFDDDEFSRKIILSHINTYFYSEKFKDDKTFVIHQHHERQTQDKEALQKWEINKNFFIRDHKKYVNIYLKYYLNKNIVNQKQLINQKQLNNKNTFELVLDKKDIFYTANIDCIVFHEDLNKTLNNSIFNLTCQIKNHDKKFVHVNNVKINIYKNVINYTGKLNNLVNNGLFFDSNTIKIMDIQLILKNINYQNDGLLIIDDKQWLYKNVPKIAHFFVNNLTFETFQNINNFYVFNPDWMIKIHYTQYSNLNKNLTYYNILNNFDDVEFEYTEMDEFINKDYSYDYTFIKILSNNNGLWINSEKITFNKNVLDEQFNYLNYDEKYNNDLIISSDTRFYEDLLNVIDNKFNGFDTLVKSLFSIDDIKKKYNIINTNHLFINTVKNNNYYNKIISKFNNNVEYLIILNNDIFYEYYSDSLLGTYKIIGNYLVIYWNNEVVNYYIKNDDNVYILQIYNNFNFNLYNIHNNSSTYNLQDILNKCINENTLESLNKYTENT